MLKNFLMTSLIVSFVLEDVLHCNVNLDIAGIFKKGFGCLFFHHFSNGEISFVSFALWNLDLLGCLCGKSRGSL